MDLPHRLDRAFEWKSGTDQDNYLLSRDDVRDIRDIGGGKVELDLRLSSQWVDEYRFLGLIDEFGPLGDVTLLEGGCDTCGYGCTYEAILGPKEA